MKHSSRHPQKGSLVLVALCLVAVLGIALASYLAVSVQSMKLSDRSIQTGLSAHLAEMGLEEAMRAINTNNWATWTNNGTTATWSVSGTTASCTITLPASKYAKGGSGGVIGSIKVRVDNYNAFNLPSIWSTSINYRINDLIGDNTIWYRCVQHHTSSASNRPPNQAYWTEAPIAWTWSKDIAYTLYSVVNYNGIWYRCILGNTNQVPPNVTYWAVIQALTLPWNGTATYYTDSFAYYSGLWYRYIYLTPSSGIPPSTPTHWTAVASETPYFSWRWGSAITYAANDLVYHSGVWYRCILAHTNAGPPNAIYWEDALNVYWNWSSAASYNIGDVVYRSAAWYRCIQAHTNKGPPNITYWSDAPLLADAWDSTRALASGGYSMNDFVFYHDSWYRCLTANTLNPPTNSTDWASTSNSTYLWNSTATYTTSSYVSFGKTWYRCILAPTSHQAPTDSTYWSSSTASGRVMGNPVIYAEGTTTLPDGSAAIKTQLRAAVTTAPLFPNAIAAASTLTITGAGTVDSYDGSSGTYNQTTAPFSVDSPNLGYSAVIAGGNTTSPAVTVTNTTVKGYVAAPSASTTPYAPLWNPGVGVTVTGSSATGIDLTRVSRSPYIPQFDIQSVASATNLALVNNATNTIGTPGARAPTVYNITSSTNRINLNTVTDLLIINGPVVLNVASDFNISNGKMLITTNGSAEIHVGGNLAISGTNGIDNRTLDPKKLIIMSKASGGSYSYRATLPLYGCIYLPNAINNLTIGSGVVIYGALSAKNITFSGAADLHYDTSLRYAIFGGIDAPYIISEWRELTDPAERAVLP